MKAGDLVIIKNAPLEPSPIGMVVKVWDDENLDTVWANIIFQGMRGQVSRFSEIWLEVISEKRLNTSESSASKRVKEEENEDQNCLRV